MAPRAPRTAHRIVVMTSSALHGAVCPCRIRRSRAAPALVDAEGHLSALVSVSVGRLLAYKARGRLRPIRLLKTAFTLVKPLIGIVVGVMPRRLARFSSRGIAGCWGVVAMCGGGELSGPSGRMVAFAVVHLASSRGAAQRNEHYFSSWVPGGRRPAASPARHAPIDRSSEISPRSSAGDFRKSKRT